MPLDWRSWKNTWTFCLAAGINVEGINSEVATAGWEFRIFAKGTRETGRKNLS